MIHIVTGKINSGKSTTIYDLYQKIGRGDGFVSIKRMHYHTVHGYDVMRLATGDTKLLVVREEYNRKNYDIICQIGPYQFLKDTLVYVEQTIRELIYQNTAPIFLDEIGQLELYDQCFHQIFSEIIAADVECYITVRRDLVDEVVTKYELQDFELLEV